MNPNSRFDYTALARKLRRIERLTYFLDWYWQLCLRSNSYEMGSYYEGMAMKCYSKLRDLGHVVSDVSDLRYDHG